MNATAALKPPVWFSIVALVALLWNLIGCGFYLGQVGVLGPPFAQPAAPTNMPVWVTGAYAIGVFGGALGSLGLLLRQRWAKIVLWISLLALIVDWGWVFTSIGGPALPLGLTVLVIAALLAWLANTASRRGWLG